MPRDLYRDVRLSDERGRLAVHRRRAIAAGYSVATAPEEANVVVLNTCTVRDNAERRAYGRMHHLKALKRADPSRATRRHRLSGRTGSRPDAAARAARRRDLRHARAARARRSARRLAAEFRRRRFQRRRESCSRRSAAPPTASPARSRTCARSSTCSAAVRTTARSASCRTCAAASITGRRADILDEVRAVASRRARARSCWSGRRSTRGRSRRPAPTSAISASQLRRSDRRRAADASSRRIRRISPRRSSTIWPRCRSSIRASTSPLQSGSDPMLRRMNRKYTVERVRRERRDVSAGASPDWAITTDIIVGFPGETEDDFERRSTSSRRGVFANAFMFIYSTRRGTPAAHWEQVPREVALERFARLLRRAERRHPRLSRPQDRHDRARADPSASRRKTPTGLRPRRSTTSRSSRRSRRTTERYARRRGSTSPSKRAHVWGCTGAIVGRAARLERRPRCP